MARVAIVIVTYNSGSEIGGCLDALAGVADLEIVVVDNASWDGTRNEVAQRPARLVTNETNAGFAAAVNLGVRATTAPLILLMNPDAHYVSGLERLIQVFDDPSAGAAGGILTGPDGLPQTGFMARNLPSALALIFEVLGINKLWPGNPVNWHYRCKGISQLTAISSPIPVEQPAGAFLMFPRAAWLRVGGFDERFWPIWFEDVDFCARLKLAGLRVWLAPGAFANHKGAHSIDTLPSKDRQRFWYGSLLEYAAKFYTPLEFRILCCAVFGGSVLRALGGLPRHGWRIWSVFGPVCLLAISRFRGRKSGEPDVFNELNGASGSNGDA